MDFYLLCLSRFVHVDLKDIITSIFTIQIRLVLVLLTKFKIWDSLRFDMHISTSAGWVKLQTFRGDTNLM